MSVLQAVTCKRVAGPLVGAFQVFRTGESRTETIGEFTFDFHHLGVAEAFFANPRHHLEIRLIGGSTRGGGQGGEGQHKDGDEDGSSKGTQG